MRGLPFWWVHRNGRRKDYPSYSEAARALNVTESTIRYYVRQNIHDAKQLHWKRKK